jgi:hypothetical protein
MHTLRMNSANGNEIATMRDRQDTFNRYTSMSVKNFPNHFSTCAVTEEDRFRERPDSRNMFLEREISDLKSKYENLKDKVD